LYNKNFSKKESWNKSSFYKMNFGKNMNDKSAIECFSKKKDLSNKSSWSKRKKTLNSNRDF
jgi:hypothetical protein